MKTNPKNKCDAMHLTRPQRRHAGMQTFIESSPHSCKQQYVPGKGTPTKADKNVCNETWSWDSIPCASSFSNSNRIYDFSWANMAGVSTVECRSKTKIDEDCFHLLALAVHSQHTLSIALVSICSILWNSRAFDCSLVHWRNLQRTKRAREKKNRN